MDPSYTPAKILICSYIHGISMFIAEDKKIQQGFKCLTNKYDSLRESTQPQSNKNKISFICSYAQR